LLSSGYEFTFGSAEAYFPAGKAGRVIGRGVKVEGDVEAAKAKADGLFRVWSTIMSDPAAFPMFKGGYPLTVAGKAGLAKWNPRDNVLLKCGTKGTPLIMISPLPMEFSKDGDKIIMRLEEYDTVRTVHMNAKDVAPAAHTLYGYSRGRWEGTTFVVETDHIAAGYFDHEGTPQSAEIKTVERFIPPAAAQPEMCASGNTRPCALKTSTGVLHCVSRLGISSHAWARRAMKPISSRFQRPTLFSVGS